MGMLKAKTWKYIEKSSPFKRTRVLVECVGVKMLNPSRVSPLTTAARDPQSAHGYIQLALDKSSSVGSSLERL